MLAQVDAFAVLAEVAAFKSPGRLRTDGRRHGDRRPGFLLADGQHLPQGLVGHTPGQTVGNVAGSDDHHAKLVLRQGRKFGGKTINGSCMADTFMTFQVREAKTQAVPSLLSSPGKLRGPHLLERGCLDHLPARPLASGEQGD